ncbi:MAG TPA: LLM class flavin-dependent oxidoreductase, partial [Anaerolineales bacterium]|nr:LLM class flavin-dependent oxidoreductase [Anaerolineales bacterium]
LNFRGEYYKITLMSPFFNPGPLLSPKGEGLGVRSVPIYIAGVNTGLAKLAGELCEGFHVHPFHSVRYLREVILPAVEEGAAKERRKKEDVSVSVTAFVATTSEEMNFARAQVSFYASTPSYRPVMDLHGWSGIAEKLSAHASRGEWGEMPMLITDEMLNEFCLVTEESTLADELKKRYDRIADRLTLYTPFVPGEKYEWWKKLSGEFNS